MGNRWQVQCSRQLLMMPGQVGAGIAHPPMACFTRALEALDALVSSRSEGAEQAPDRERNPD